ncbi:DNA ligase [Paenibacillus sp. N1-5-1-14]|uniref:ATP-dependent DNA ligase n=1 Tax=Paenibacillus radicibacter TaxID=2972488 RepID=UPI002158F7BD|nr:DNA ligase [Paenibacillus radicibacter]MCR8641510.1 DNA ligase [Paenibacillus radicibacter]
MLLQYAKNNEAFDSPDYLAELKLDGIRLIVSNLEQLKLYTRHNNDVTAKFPELHEIDLPSGTILDGEVIVTDERGKPDFESMMSRFQSKKDKRHVTFCAFDILRYRGVDVTGLSLVRRKELLEDSFVETERYTKVRTINGSSLDYFEAIKQHNLEGIVIKKKNSVYEIDRRSWSWQKVINWTYAEAYITGYRKKEFGWLTSMQCEDGTFIPTGIIELGATPEHKKAFNSVKQRLSYKEDKNFAYMEPLIRVRVKTRNWTKNGMLRSPVFVEYIL